jgi:hypothetical protein
MQKQTKLVIVEGVEGYWRYHWAPGGARTMPTSVPVWGMQPGNDSIRYKWCDVCAKMKANQETHHDPNPHTKTHLA